LNCFSQIKKFRINSSKSLTLFKNQKTGWKNSKKEVPQWNWAFIKTQLHIASRASYQTGKVKWWSSFSSLTWDKKIPIIDFRKRNFGEAHLKGQGFKSWSEGFEPRLLNICTENDASFYSSPVNLIPLRLLHTSTNYFERW
jgi:hypothetical protein